MLNLAYLQRISTFLLTIGGFILLGMLLVYALQSSLILIIIVLAITYILNPVVEKIQYKFHLSRKSVAFIFSFLGLLIIILIPILLFPVLLNQIKVLNTRIPSLIEMLNQYIFIPFNARFHSHFNLDNKWIMKFFFPEQELSKDLTLNTILPIAKGSLSALSGTAATILIPFILFYTLKNWYQILNFVERLLPRRYSVQSINIIKDIDKSLSFYMRGQFWVIIVMAIYYIIALNFAKLPAATIIGGICGILVFVPYLGYSVSLLIVALLAMTEFNGFSQIITLAVIMLIGNLIENFIATPFLIGDSIGLNPIMIIIALIICGNLFGFVGLIASLPITAIGVVLIKHLLEFYFNSDYYQRNIR